jgi:pyruvate dehydrogenase E1 component
MSINDRDAFSTNSADRDPQETQEWLESLEAVAAHSGRGRARELMQSLL